MIKISDEIKVVIYSTIVVIVFYVLFNGFLEHRLIVESQQPHIAGYYLIYYTLFVGSMYVFDIIMKSKNTYDGDVEHGE